MCYSVHIICDCYIIEFSIVFENKIIDHIDLDINCFKGVEKTKNYYEVYTNKKHLYSSVILDSYR